jgi:hypothetical protein
MTTHETSAMFEAQVAHNTLAVSDLDHHNSPHIVCPVKRAVVQSPCLLINQITTAEESIRTWNLMSRVVAAP